MTPEKFGKTLMKTLGAGMAAMAAHGKGHHEQFHKFNELMVNNALAFCIEALGPVQGILAFEAMGRERDEIEKIATTGQTIAESN